MVLQKPLPDLVCNNRLVVQFYKQVSCIQLTSLRFIKVQTELILSLGEHCLHMFHIFIYKTPQMIREKSRRDRHCCTIVPCIIVSKRLGCKSFNNSTLSD